MCRRLLVLSFWYTQMGHSKEAAVRSGQALQAVLLLWLLRGAERSAR